jgi:hypothetical protein
MGLGLNPSSGGSSAGEAGYIAPDEQYKVVFFYDDFITYHSGTVDPWVAFHSGSAVGFVASPSDFTDHPGIAKLGTNGLNNYCTLATGLYGSFLLGDGEDTQTWITRIQSLSTAGNVMTSYMGYRYATSWSAISSWPDGIWFEYNFDESPNWRVTTRRSGTSTTTATSEVVDTDWHKFEIIVNADATSVVFKIDGTVVATHTTNIPTTTTRSMDRVLLSRRISYASGSKFMYVDFYSHKKVLTNPRY